MKKKLPKYPRILAIAPNTKGVGFVVIEGVDILVNWGVMIISGDKNDGAVKRADQMIAHYEPDVLVQENCLKKPFRRSARIRQLTRRILRLAEKRNVVALSFTRQQIQSAFLSGGQGNKHDVAKVIAEKFSVELGSRLPPKSNVYDGEDGRLKIFEAAALALMVRERTKP